ncbi:type VII secretion protein EccB [Actinacidiphila yeochonensis]|uniref:type VII secretion protein EccB n=1 Tax=Actinacidiphila yeochonensis TaxID=89050 RepID=UPI00068A495E|nr:type VII secretion protein EccB [Actinacidiphila yeochonensis]
MQSRRDQVQAHLFVMGRLSSSMLRGDPDTPDAPESRNWRGVMGGVVLAALAAVGVALYGLIVPGTTSSWRTPGALVLVSGTSSRYLYVGDALHPVLNEASAKLLAGTQMSVHTVSARSLAGTPHGAPVGIQGAPDMLPGSGDGLYDGTWWACAGSTADTSGGAARSTLQVSAGQVSGGRGLTAGQAALVSSPDGRTQMLWQGRRYPLDTAHGVPAALGWSGEAPYRVGDAFLDTLPAGPSVAPPEVAGRGSAGPALSGAPTRYGQVFTATGGQHLLLTKAGLVPLTPLLYDVVIGDPRTQAQAYQGGAVTARTIGAADLAAHQAPASAGTALAQGLPESAPRLVTAGTGQDVCSAVSPGGSAPTTTVSIVDRAAVPSAVADTEPGVQPGCLAADGVTVPAGEGALVRGLSSAGWGAYEYLVTDAGVAYPLTADGAKQLGYSDAAAVALPTAWLQLLPSGPRLDPSVLADGGVVREQAGAPACGAPRAGRHAGPVREPRRGPPARERPRRRRPER